MGLHCLHRRVYPSKNLLEFRDSRTFFVYRLCNDSSKHFFLSKYSKTSMARTRIARIPWMI